MIGGIVNSFAVPMPAGGGNVSVDLRRLLSTIHQMPVHMTAIELKLVISATPHANTAEPGGNFANILDRIEVLDINSNMMVRMQGWHCDALVKAATGWRYPTPADIPGDGGDASTYYWQARIPFHGGPGGVAGYSEFKDCIQPIDRFRETSMEIYFDAGAFDNAALDAAVLHVSFTGGPYKAVNQGADIRYGYMVHHDAQRFELPINGKAVQTAALLPHDRDCSDVTAVTIEQFSYMNNVLPWQLYQAWNSNVAQAPAQFLLHLVPEFLPLIFQERRGSIQQAIGFPGQKAFMDITNTIGTTSDLCWVQVHNTKRLADKLLGRAGTCYQDKRLRKAKFSKKNGKNNASMARMEALLPQELVRA